MTAKTTSPLASRKPMASPNYPVRPSNMSCSLPNGPKRMLCCSRLAGERQDCGLDGLAIRYHKRLPMGFNRSIKRLGMGCTPSAR
jgi:hypothetical protein